MVPYYSQKTFGPVNPKAPAPSKDLHGGKGYGLLTMAQAGFLVPEAMILTTEAWRYYRKYDTLSPPTVAAIKEMLSAFPTAMFSVRSGAPVSMPGMMDTVLNVGATPDTDLERPGAFRRFALGWLEIVKGVDKETTRLLMERVTGRERQGGTPTAYLLNAVLQRSGHTVPTTAFDQVVQCVEAVFRSWDTPRAIAYRKMHGISESMGTACIIQRMVMGTAPGLSGSGVMFSRDPATGEDTLTGEIAFNAQGEEVVNGSVTPMSLSKLAHSANPEWETLHDRLCQLAGDLEMHYGDVQDVEFTVESGELYVLQTRTAKMSASARIVTACSLLNYLPFEARLPYLRERVSKGLVASTMVASVATSQAPAAVGLAASPGAISGKLVFRSTPLGSINKATILVAQDTAPEDFPQMAASGGILTATGGFTCHSAVVARGIGVPAVVGCDSIEVDNHKRRLILPGGKVFKEGDVVTIDGATGKVWPGSHKVTINKPPAVLWSTLFKILSHEPDFHPENVWWVDADETPKVAISLPIGNADACEAQIARAAALTATGKQVAFTFTFTAPDEDLVPPDPASLFQGLANTMGPDLSGALFVPTIPEVYAKAAMRVLKVKPVPDQNGVVRFGNLLDALDQAGTN